MWEKLKSLISGKCDVEDIVSLLKTQITPGDYQLYIAAGTMNLPISEQNDMKAKFSTLAKSIASVSSNFEEKEWKVTAWMLDPKEGGSGRVTRVY